MCEDVWQSNAEWDINHCLGRKSDGVTTDTHLSMKAAMAVCACLETEGFGYRGEHYPIQTWVTKVGEVDPIQETITLNHNIRLAEEETEKLLQERIIQNKTFKE